jgi:hypothetical protein
MRTIALLLGLIVGGLILAPNAASAQATRTWVSGVGDDVNPCSRTAPCKTFAGAISKTAAGGEISVLDPGGYGALTITKNISITNDGAGEAGILASGTNAITINTAGVVVNIRGLIIDGAPPTTPGLNGINFLQGNALHLQNCQIKNFQSAAAGSGFGIKFAPSTAAKLYVSDCVISDNGSGANGAGIQIQPTGAGSAKVVLTRVLVENNVIGLRADGTGSTGGINVTVKDSVSSGNAYHGIIAATAPGGGTVNVMLDHSAAVNNGGIGIRANGASAIVRMNDVTVTGNATGLDTLNGGQLLSYGNNHIAGNGSAGVAPSVIGQQ